MVWAWGFGPRGWFLRFKYFCSGMKCLKKRHWFCTSMNLLSSRFCPAASVDTSMSVSLKFGMMECNGSISTLRVLHVKSDRKPLRIQRFTEEGCQP